jgi:hypothetical protein
MGLMGTEYTDYAEDRKTPEFYPCSSMWSAYSAFEFILKTMPGGAGSNDPGPALRLPILNGFTFEGIP